MQKLNALAAGLQKEAEDQLGDEAHFSSDDEFDQICGGGEGRRESGPSGHDSWSRDLGSRQGESSLQTARHSNHNLDRGGSFHHDDRFLGRNVAARDAGCGENSTTTTTTMEDETGKASRWDKYLAEEGDVQAKGNKRMTKENKPEWGKTAIEFPPPTWKRLKMDQGGPRQSEGSSQAPGVREKLGVRRLGQEMTTWDAKKRKSERIEDKSNGGDSDGSQERQQAANGRKIPDGAAASFSGASSSGSAVKTGSHLAGMTEEDWNEMLEDF